MRTNQIIEDMSFERKALIPCEVYKNDGLEKILSGQHLTVLNNTSKEFPSNDLEIKLSRLQKENTLKEREQKTLHNILELLNTNQPTLKTAKEITNLIKELYSPYDQIDVMFSFNKVNVYSDKFEEKNQKLEFLFEVLNKKCGSICLYYSGSLLKEHFIKAENINNFLNLIIGVLKNWLNKVETEHEFRNMFVKLESKVENKTKELTNTNKMLQDINKDIYDSINYAKRIQKAILPERELIKKAFEDSFVFYKPKDIVSGDFYWFHESKSKIYYACADCTGHGVPGALMSMVGNQLLNQIIVDEKKEDSAEILNELDKSIVKLFKKSYLGSNFKDGMSISLCVIDKNSKTLSFSGSYNNAYLFRGGDKIITLEANRFPIGGHDGTNKNIFDKTEITIEPNDKLYMFTDGLPDQFGGPNGKKLMRRRLLEIINNLKNHSMNVQLQSFENLLTEWKGDGFQVDDVTLIGVKL